MSFYCACLNMNIFPQTNFCLHNFPVMRTDYLKINYRTFGRLGWRVSEIGYGHLGGGSGPGGWQGCTDQEFLEAMHESVRLGCNFFDTAWVYGRGHSEQLVGAVVRSLPAKKLYVATKIPPKNMLWPCPKGVRF